MHVNVSPRPVGDDILHWLVQAELPDLGAISHRTRHAFEWVINSVRDSRIE